MAKYDVYGIGNALVDMEYEIEVADLETLGIDKGVMTLVDEQCQLRMMDHLAAYPHQRSSGGSAANSMIAVRQFGGTSFYSCKDDLGHFYMKDLLDGGVDTNHHTEKEAGHTGRCVVLVTPDSDRTLCTFLGISGELSTKELVEDALRDSKYFYMEGYLVTSETARQACIAAKRIAEAAGVKTAISLSDPNMVRFFKAGLLEMIGSGVDLLFANEDEAKGVVGTADLDSATDYLKTLSQEFVITRGSKGALVWDGQTLIDIDPVKVKAVDTVGAGDMFAGAFLYGRGRGWDHRRAGALASAASAKLVTSLGPRMSAAETQTVLHNLL
ncbi:MAG: adenosine kinase [Candidatus Competibacter sp.]|nr:adenosine kinase [Candidatus Competibacter sp.]